MDAVHEERFVVFALEPADAREDAPWHLGPEDLEREVASCATYHDARLVRQRFQAAARKCVIRYVGPAGGGD